MKISKKKELIEPKRIPYLIYLFYSNRDNPIPLKNYCCVILGKDQQSYTLALIKEFGFDLIKRFWNRYKFELLKRNQFFNDEVFEDYEKVYKKYSEPFEINIVLENNTTLILDKRESLYYFSDNRNSRKYFSKFELNENEIKIYIGLKKIDIFKIAKGIIMEEELEPNYEIQVFSKSDNKFMDSYFTYSDDKSTALDEAIKHFKDEYSISDYNYVVEYWGELESDRGYEMSLESEIYKN